MNFQMVVVWFWHNLVVNHQTSFDTFEGNFDLFQPFWNNVIVFQKLIQDLVSR